MTDLTRAQVEQLRPLATCDQQVVRLDEHGSHVGVYTALALMLDTDASMRARLEEVEKALETYRDQAGENQCWKVEHMEIAAQLATAQARVRELEATAMELADLKLALWCPPVLSCFLCGKGPLLPEQLAVRWRDSLLGFCGDCHTLTARCTRLEEALKRVEAYAQGLRLPPHGTKQTVNGREVGSELVMLLTPTTLAGDQCSVSIAHPAHDWCKGIPFAPAGEEEGK